MAVPAPSHGRYVEPWRVATVALPPGVRTAQGRDRYVMQRGGNVYPTGGLPLREFQARYGDAQVLHVEAEPQTWWTEEGDVRWLDGEPA